MKILIVYYSHTGNNRILATETAKKLGAEIIEIEEIGSRSNNRIVMDMIFHRYPKIKDTIEQISDFDLVIFFSPIWMFGVASPLRTFIKAMRSHIRKYAFVSLSGGALGPNTRISKELVKRLGKNQAFLLDFSITHFLPVEQNKDLKAISNIFLKENSDMVRSLSTAVTETVKALM